MTTASNEPKRSSEYTQLIEQLKSSMDNLLDTFYDVMEQSKKEGISHEEMRHDVIKTMNENDIKLLSTLARILTKMLDESKK